MTRPLAPHRSDAIDPLRSLARPKFRAAASPDFAKENEYDGRGSEVPLDSERFRSAQRLAGTGTMVAGEVLPPFHTPSTLSAPIVRLV
jgi:hypothetical protein